MDNPGKKITIPTSLSRDSGVVLSSLYLAPVSYYSVLFRARQAVIEIHERYRKQSYRNRCIIAGANGTMALSIPIEKPEPGKTTMKDIRIAEHGNWRHTHWNAILSAYNSTPFFTYYADDFHSYYEKRYTFLHDFNEELRLTACRLLDIQPTVSFTDQFMEDVPRGMSDFREQIHPKSGPETSASGFQPKEYYQVFAHKYGFIKNLSIIDLLCNMGNEARLYL